MPADDVANFTVVTVSVGLMLELEFYVANTDRSDAQWNDICQYVTNNKMENRCVIYIVTMLDAGLTHYKPTCHTAWKICYA